MSENIQSISQGTYTIGQTSALNFEAGPGIKIDSPSAGTVRIGNDFNKIVVNDIITAGYYTEGGVTYPILQKTVNVPFTTTTAYQTGNVIYQGSISPWSGASVKWLDVGNSFMNYGGQARLATNYQLDGNRIGNIVLLTNGALSYRGKDSNAASITGTFTIKWLGNAI